MKALFHSIIGLSIGLATLGAVAGGAAAPASPHFGRWTVSDPAARFTTKGKPFKTIDIAPCGKDFCGVSVGDRGQCGATLFRFLIRNAGAPMLHGHTRWGGVSKNIQIENWENPEGPGGREIEIYVGDGYDFGGRSDSMPKYNAVYKRIGEARCKVR